MGLDMYLDKVKRIGNATLEKISLVEEYYGWKERGEEYKHHSMKRWCGIDRKDVDMDLAKHYQSEYVKRFASWDTKKEYGWKSLFQNIVYWRKANQIHAWFVENVQDGIDDCGKHEVTKEHLEELLRICRIVRNDSLLVEGKVCTGYNIEGPIYEDGKIIYDATTARELLPTQSGFFFGSTEYNEWYLEDIEKTIVELEKVLKETDFDNWIVFYQSSW